jgi:hypothetical protein
VKAQHLAAKRKYSFLLKKIIAFLLTRTIFKLILEYNVLSRINYSSLRSSCALKVYKSIM